MSTHQDSPPNWKPYITFAVLAAIASCGGMMALTIPHDGRWQGAILLIFFGLAAIVVPLLQALHHRDS